MTYKARRVKALTKPKSVAAQAGLREKNVYGADARSELAYRPYAMFDGTDAYRPTVMGFQPNGSV